MLWAIAFILIGLWLFGILAGFALGAFIHLLLVLAMVLLLIRILQDRKFA
jgi:hypothetical protein